MKEINLLPFVSEYNGFLSINEKKNTISNLSFEGFIGKELKNKKNSLEEYLTLFAKVSVPLSIAILEREKNNLFQKENLPIKIINNPSPEREIFLSILKKLSDLKKLFPHEYQKLKKNCADFLTTMKNDKQSLLHINAFIEKIMRGKISTKIIGEENKKNKNEFTNEYEILENFIKYPDNKKIKETTKLLLENLDTSKNKKLAKDVETLLYFISELKGVIKDEKLARLSQIFLKNISDKKEKTRKKIINNTDIQKPIKEIFENICPSQEEVKVSQIDNENILPLSEKIEKEIKEIEKAIENEIIQKDIVNPENIKNMKDKNLVNYSGKVLQDYIEKISPYICMSRQIPKDELKILNKKVDDLYKVLKNEFATILSKSDLEEILPFLKDLEKLIGFVKERNFKNLKLNNLLHHLQELKGELTSFSNSQRVSILYNRIVKDVKNLMDNIKSFHENKYLPEIKEIYENLEEYEKSKDLLIEKKHFLSEKEPIVPDKKSVKVGKINDFRLSIIEFFQKDLPAIRKVTSHFEKILSNKIKSEKSHYISPEVLYETIKDIAKDFSKGDEKNNLQELKEIVFNYSKEIKEIIHEKLQNKGEKQLKNSEHISFEVANFIRKKILQNRMETMLNLEEKSENKLRFEFFKSFRNEQNPVFNLEEFLSNKKLKEFIENELDFITLEFQKEPTYSLKIKEIDNNFSVILNLPNAQTIKSSLQKIPEKNPAEITPIKNVKKMSKVNINEMINFEKLQNTDELKSSDNFESTLKMEFSKNFTGFDFENLRVYLPSIKYLKQMDNLEITINLYPPTMGHIRIKSSIKDKKIKITCLVNNQYVKNLLERNKSILIEHFAKDGYEASVKAELNNSENTFSNQYFANNQSNNSLEKSGTKSAPLIKRTRKLNRKRTGKINIKV